MRREASGFHKFVQAAFQTASGHNPFHRKTGRRGRWRIVPMTVIGGTYWRFSIWRNRWVKTVCFRMGMRGGKTGGLKKFDVQVCVLSGRSLPKLMPILAYCPKKAFLPVKDRMGAMPKRWRTSLKNGCRRRFGIASRKNVIFLMFLHGFCLLWAGSRYVRTAWRTKRLCRLKHGADYNAEEISLRSLSRNLPWRTCCAAVS